MAPKRLCRTCWTPGVDDQYLFHRLDSLDWVLLPRLRRGQGGREPAHPKHGAAVRPTGIRINAILAGLIDTPMASRELSEGDDITSVRADRRAKSPTGAMGSAQDVANAALFFASDESAFVTGTMLPVDDGLHARVI